MKIVINQGFLKIEDIERIVDASADTPLTRLSAGTISNYSDQMMPFALFSRIVKLPHLTSLSLSNYYGGIYGIPGPGRTGIACRVESEQEVEELAEYIATQSNSLNIDPLPSFHGVRTCDVKCVLQRALLQ